MTLVDDDDYLAADYMAHVLPHLDGDLDFVGLRVLQIINGAYYGSATTRGAGGFGRVEHGPTPKGVTRADIWREAGMANHYTADRDWCARVGQMVRSHVFIDRDLYVYDHHTRSSAFIGNGAQRDVGVWPFDESKVHRMTSG